MGTQYTYALNARLGLFTGSFPDASCVDRPYILKPEAESQWAAKSSCPMPKDTGSALIYVGSTGTGSSEFQKQHSMPDDNSYPHGTQVRFDCVPNPMDEGIR